MTAKTHRNALPENYRLLWYQIEKVLGHGGFGITYLATDTNLERQVAVKEYLPTELATREGENTVHPIAEDQGELYLWGLERFIGEAKALAKFEHPDIVRVFNVFNANNTAYMVMAYEQGQSLSKLIEAEKASGEAWLMNLVLPLLDGLEHVHEAGFIHRDIKPANIYVRTGGSPVLLDFGSARLALGVQTRTLTTLVSPGYAPYEQYSTEGGQQGPWTDIYALGATLYAAITGKGPVDAISRAIAHLKGQADPLVSAAELGKDRFTPRFLKAIDTAMAFMREDRPQIISEWRQMLQRPAEDRDTVPQGSNESMPQETHDLTAPTPRATQRETVAEATEAMTAPHPARVFRRELALVGMVMGVIALAVVGIWMGTHTKRVSDSVAQIGRLVIASIPAGAEWYLGGAYVGETPDGMTAIEVGSHRIEAIKPGDKAWRQTVEIKAGQTARLNAHLDTEKVEYALSVKTEPADARVQILNIGANYYPGIRLKPGRYHIEISQPGYLTHKEWVKIADVDRVVEVILHEGTI